MNRWLKLLDRFSPSAIATPRERLRGRILVACTLLFAIWGPVYSLYFYFVVGLITPAVIDACSAVLAMAILVWYRQSGSLEFAGALLTFLALGVLFANAQWFGGLSAPSMTWVPVIPLLGIFISGRKTGWGVCIAAGIALSSLYVFTEPTEPSVSPESVRAYLAFSLVTIVLLALSLGLAYESLYDHALSAERKASEDLRRLAVDLDAARSDAEAASAAKSQFLANMSHEIRTPLNGVLGMIELTRYTELTAEQRELLDTAHSSGKILLRLVNDVLDVSKLEATALELERVPFSPKAVIDEAIAEHAASAASRGIGLVANLHPDLEQPVLGDPYRFRQIITNLAGNAVKFTEEGSVVVRGRRKDELLEITVTDTGIGMSSEVTDRVFSPFAQADTSTTRRFGGTGLGLTICAELADRMGGSLSVESKPGEGSSFTLLLALPVAPDADAEPSSGEALDRAPVGEAAPSPEPLRVLVAEDNQVNARLTQRLLEELGHQVTVVDDGRTACESVADATHDLVLMDLHMPTMGGIEATREIRKRGQCVPIVALTASALQCDIDACAAAGMNGFISKPIGLQSLAQEIARITAQEKPDRALEKLGGDSWKAGVKTV